MDGGEVGGRTSLAGVLSFGERGVRETIRNSLSGLTIVEGEKGYKRGETVLFTKAKALTYSARTG